MGICLSDDCFGMPKCSHLELNQGPCDGCKIFQSDALPTGTFPPLSISRTWHSPKHCHRVLSANWAHGVAVSHPLSMREAPRCRDLIFSFPAIVHAADFEASIFLCNVAHKHFTVTMDTQVATKKMHQPGIEPGSHRWQRCILPLDH